MGKYTVLHMQRKLHFFFFFKVMIKITGVNLELHSHTCTCSVDTEEIFQIGSFICCKVNTRRVNCLIYGTQYEPVMECIYEEGKCKYRIQQKKVFPVENNIHSIVLSH